MRSNIGYIAVPDPIMNRALEYMEYMEYMEKMVSDVPPHTQVSHLPTFYLQTKETRQLSYLFVTFSQCIPSNYNRANDVAVCVAVCVATYS